MEILTTAVIFNMLCLLQAGGERRRHRRYSPHPGFTMFNTGMGRMNLPSFALGPSLNGGMASYSSGECIREDIVCPRYCVMEDEWGCKSCPCGPANGMSPPRAPEQHHAASESKHDCMGTILCMLTCKDGYKLGQREENGCQTCTCKKKNATQSQQSGGDCIGPACSAKNGMRLMTQLHVPVTTPRPRMTTTSAPKPTPPRCEVTEICKKTCKYNVKLGKTGSDGCPTCLCVKTNKTETTTAQTTTTTHSDCLKTLQSIQNCRNGYQLGPETETDGCPVCHCIIVPTTPKSPTFVMVPLTSPPVVQAPVTEPPCEEVTRCIKSCRYGYRVEHTSSYSECPECRCIIPLTPPPPTPAPKSDFLSVLRTCPEAVHCMKTCPNGYTLTRDGTQTCPVCSCNRGTTVLVYCKEALSCHQGCTVGYKCDTIGCPTCSCIKPSETQLTVEIHTPVIQSALRCRPNFSCIERCELGYRTGDNGCPTCECILPRKVQISQVQTSSHTQLQPGMSVSQGHPGASMYSSGIGQYGAQHKGTGCLGPACSAPGARGQISVNPTVSPQLFLTQAPPMFLVSQVRPSSQGNLPQSEQLVLTQSGAGCKGPLCLGSNTKGNVTVNSHVQGVSNLISFVNSTTNHLSGSSSYPTPSAIPSLDSIKRMCPEIAKCLHNCKTGFNIGDAKPGECPPCSCLTDEASSQPTILTTEAMPSVAEACPETVKCMVDCNGPYNLTTSGRLCPTCTCLQTASACQGETCFAMHETKRVPSSTPSPGECLAILHCVLTCKRGYDVGDVGKDGCPTCLCID